MPTEWCCAGGQGQAAEALPPALPARVRPLAGAGVLAVRCICLPEEQGRAARWRRKRKARARRGAPCASQHRLCVPATQRTACRASRGRGRCRQWPRQRRQSAGHDGGWCATGGRCCAAASIQAAAHARRGRAAGAGAARGQGTLSGGTRSGGTRSRVCRSGCQRRGRSDSTAGWRCVSLPPWRSGECSRSSSA